MLPLQYRQCRSLGDWQVRAPFPTPNDTVGAMVAGGRTIGDAPECAYSGCIVLRIIENAIVVYTDGSCLRGRRGGYGMVFVHHDGLGNEHEIDTHSPPGMRGATNNSMELQAVVDALERVRDAPEFGSVPRIVIRTDSQYVSKHFMSALGAWPRNKWHTWQGRPVENAKLWRDFARVYRKVGKRIEIEWVKGHRGKRRNPGNEQADKLARASAESPLIRRTYRGSTRRKLSATDTKIGSVLMRGQTMKIRIIGVESLRLQRLWKYRYEVMSTESDDFGKVDLIFSGEHMRDGHTFEVRVNDVKANPRILEVIRELLPAESLASEGESIE